MEQYLINHCAPTLASLKTANLFNYSFASETELHAQLLRLNDMLAIKGVSLTVIRKTTSSALIYVYRKRNWREISRANLLPAYSKSLAMMTFLRKAPLRTSQNVSIVPENFRMRLVSFWAIRPAMSWAISKTTAGIANAAAAGRFTAMNVRHARRFADLTSVKRCIV